MRTEHKKDKKKWEEEEQSLKKEIMQLKSKNDALQEAYNGQLAKIKEFEKTSDPITKTKAKVVENLEEQIENLKAATEKLMKIIKDQTDLEEPRQLKAKIYELWTQKEKLRKRVENGEMERNRLQGELEKYINSRRRKYKGTKLIVP